MVPDYESFMVAYFGAGSRNRARRYDGVVSANGKNGHERPMDLSHPKSFEAFKKTRPKTWTKESARKMLVELGIYTKTGRLTKNFR